MSKMIQVRNVPDRLHKELVRRAKKKGQTLSAFVEEILEREIDRPPAEEVFERIHKMPPVKLDRPVAEYIREEWAEREEHLSRLHERRHS